MPVLGQRCGWVREGILARKIMIAILPHESVRGQNGMGVEYVRPCRRDVKGIDERPLVLPYGRLIELVWLLEPRTRIIQVHVEAVFRIGLKVHMVEHIL